MSRQYLKGRDDIFEEMIVDGKERSKAESLSSLVFMAGEQRRTLKKTRGPGSEIGGE